MARVDTPSDRFSLWPPIGAERLSRRAARQARTGQLRQRQPHSPQNNPVTAKCVCRCTSKNAGVARIDGRGGYFLVCVLRSPRAFVTDTVTDRLPDKMALMCVRSRPCRPVARKSENNTSPMQTKTSDGRSMRIGISAPTLVPTVSTKNVATQRTT